jgi:hypothetical protein
VGNIRETEDPGQAVGGATPPDPVDPHELLALLEHRDTDCEGCRRMLEELYVFAVTFNRSVSELTQGGARGILSALLGRNK